MLKTASDMHVAPRIYSGGTGSGSRSDVVTESALADLTNVTLVSVVLSLLPKVCYERKSVSSVIPSPRSVLREKECQ